MKLSTQFKILAAAAVVAGSALIAIPSASAGSFDLQNMYAQAGGAGGTTGGAAGGAGGTSGSNGASSGGYTGGSDDGRQNLSKGLPDPSSPSVGIPAHCAAMKDANQRQLCINQARQGNLGK